METDRGEALRQAVLAVRKGGTQGVERTGGWRQVGAECRGLRQRRMIISNGYGRTKRPVRLSAGGRLQGRYVAAQPPRAQRHRDRRFQIFPRRDEAVMARHSPRHLIQVAGQALVWCVNTSGGRLVSARGYPEAGETSEPFNHRSQGVSRCLASGWLMVSR